MLRRMALTTVRRSFPHITGREMSGGKRSFIGDLVDNIKNEMNKNKEMKENLKKFREEADKLEKSESLQKAREKYQSIEAETAKSSETLKKTFSDIQEKLKASLEESEYVRKGKEVAEGVSKTVERAAESVSKQSENITQSNIFQSVSQGMKAVKEEIDESSEYSRGRLYKPPEKLRKREDSDTKEKSDKVIEPNSDASGMVLHKDSQWFQSWQSFKDNNQFVHKLFDIKTKFEESDNLFIRATRTVTDKVYELFGGVFSKTEMSEVLTEIIRMDPTFDKELFIKQCQFDIIPNILEAMVRGELDVLQDWCYEAAFNVLATPIRQAQAANYKQDCRVLDINHIDIVAGKMMDQGPVLILSFTAQQIMAIRDSTGRVIEGDPEKIMRIFYVWAFCRDQTVLDPRAAWRLIDLSASPMEQWL